MSASIDNATPAKQDAMLDAPSIATLSERATPEQADGCFIAFLMPLTAVDSFLLGIRHAAKDVLLVDRDTFRAATRAMFWASRMVLVVDIKDQRLVFQVKDRLEIDSFIFNGNGNRLSCI
jgi:hypothetical protein